MDFLIADTFSDSLTRLTGDEQKAVKTTAFDLQLNPAAPGMQFHKLDKAKGKNFWSVRAGERPAANRSQGARQPAAVLRRSPRQSVQLGRATEVADPPQDGRSPVGGSPRDRAGDSCPDVCGRGNAQTGGNAEVAVCPSSGPVGGKCGALWQRVACRIYGSLSADAAGSPTFLGNRDSASALLSDRGRTGSSRPYDAARKWRRRRDVRLQTSATVDG